MTNDAGRLSGKHVVLTGAGGGIGLAVALAFVRHGARCTVADLGQVAPAALTAPALNGLVQYVPTDVTEPTQVDALLDAAEKRLDRKSTRLNSSHPSISRMPSSA